VPDDRWSDGRSYDGYVGRWSRLVADPFLDWLAVPAGARWIDMGCGTGALTGRIHDGREPRGLVGMDRSAPYLARAAAAVPAASFVVATAQAPPLGSGVADVVVSGLLVNFLPDPDEALGQLSRVVTPGGCLAAYVWDYADGMQPLRRFWDTAATLDPAAAELHEGRRFPLCRPEPLRDLWRGAGLGDVEVRPIDVVTVFAGFDDYWRPFLGGQGPAPGYCRALTGHQRALLRELLRATLPRDARGRIRLAVRAWAVKGRCR
jgi:SAM-dependent methyltransferase